MSLLGSRGAGLHVAYEMSFEIRVYWREELARRGWNRILVPPLDREQNETRIHEAARNFGARRLLFSVGEIPLTLAALRRLPEETLVYTTDDEWRFDSVGRYLGWYFNHVVTNDANQVDAYDQHGLPVRAATWAANVDVFRPLGQRRDGGVVIVGRPHADRVSLVTALLAAGIDLRIYGPGWERFPEFKAAWHGALTDQELPRVLNEASIVINTSISTAGAPAVKSRPFETAACGAFQLVQHVPDLARYYRIGEEIVTWRDTTELIDLIRKYEADEPARERIAAAALARTLAEHTVSQRLEVILGAFDDPPLVPQPSSTPILLLRLDGAIAGADAALDRVTQVGVESRSVGAVIAARLAFAREDGLDDVFVAFAEPGVTYDEDRLQLLSFGLEHDREAGRWMNLAPGEVTDGRGLSYAYPFLGRQAAAMPESLPVSTFMLSARVLADRLGGSLATASLDDVLEAARGGLAAGEFSHVDLRTGLFTYTGSGRTSLRDVYRESVSGMWDVRTRSYGRTALRRFDLPGAIRLARGLYARRSARRVHRPSA